jgi:hypothetical protein
VVAGWLSGRLFRRLSGWVDRFGQEFRHGVARN